MTSTSWPAPHHPGPVDVTVALPGSKSLTNRALLLAAIADGPSVLTRPLRSRDTELMAAAVRALGGGVDDVAGEDAWRVTPLADSPVDADVDCGLAGTVMRFVPPVAALVHGDVRLDGDPRARERPMGTVLGALRTLGVTVDDDGRDSLPFTVRGTGGVQGGVVTIDASASSQFVSALLLAGARFDEGVDVRHDGKPVPSMPHVEMTLTELRRRGVDVDDSEPNRWVVRPGPVAGLDTPVEPDLSNAGAFVAAALVTGGAVSVQGWPDVTDQAGDRWRELAGRFGADVVLEDGTLTVSATGRPAALDVDLHDEGELTPVVAAVCAVADGPSFLRGIAHLRGHETDRLAAIVAEVRRLGGEADELEDGLTIRPAPLHGAELLTYADHRMAHAAAVLGLAVPGVLVHDVATTAKTFPGFDDYWSKAFG